MHVVFLWGTCLFSFLVQPSRVWIITEWNVIGNKIYNKSWLIIYCLLGIVKPFVLEKAFLMISIFAKLFYSFVILQCQSLVGLVLYT